MLSFVNHTLWVDNVEIEQGLDFESLLFNYFSVHRTHHLNNILITTNNTSTRIITTIHLRVSIITNTTLKRLLDMMKSIPIQTQMI